LFGTVQSLGDGFGSEGRRQVRRGVVKENENINARKSKTYSRLRSFSLNTRPAKEGERNIA